MAVAGSWAWQNNGWTWGAAADLSEPVQPVTMEGTRLAITFKDSKHGAISAACNHVGGPLDEGRLEGDYVVCPWHDWGDRR